LSDVDHALHCPDNHETPDVFVWCRRCQHTMLVEPEDCSCSMCGLPVAERAPDDFYLLSS
jgi:hypothetical protein